MKIRSPGISCAIVQELWFVQVVVFVVLSTLQGQLKSEALLGDLINPHTRCDRSRSGVCSARLATLGCSVCLRGTIPTGIEKARQSLLSFERKNYPVVLHADSETSAGGNHLHKRVLFGFRINGYARAAGRAQQQQVRAHIAKNSIPSRFLDELSRCRWDSIE